MTAEQLRELLGVLEQIAEHIAGDRQHCPFCHAYRGGGYGYEEHREHCAISRVERLQEALTSEEATR